MSKRDKILYVSLNLGCLGDCKNCPTKNMIGCDKVTVEKMIDWGSFERVLAKSKAKTVCLIGGGNPFYNSSGHKNIFFHIYNKVILFTTFIILIFKWIELLFKCITHIIL